MSQNLITFGEFLEEILKKKNISIYELALRLKYKSRNPIYRLIQNKSSYDKISEFTQQLVQSNVLKLTSNEENLMEQAKQVSRWGKDTIETRIKFLKILKKITTPVLQKNEMIISNVLPNSTFTSLEDIFTSYKDYKYIEILIANGTYLPIMNILSSFVFTYCENIDIHIYHTIQMSSTNSDNIEIILSILALLSYAHYNVYYDAHSHLPLKENLAVLSDFFVVKKVDKNNHSFTDIIKVQASTSSICYYTTSKDELFNFYKTNFSQLKHEYIPLLHEFSADNTIKNLIDITKYCMEFEADSANYLLKPNPCYHLIDPKILYNLFKDSNFLGLSEEHPKVQELIDVTYKRYNAYWSKKRKIVDIFTQEGLILLAKTRKISDHFHELREFTVAETKDILRTILENYEKYPYYNFYILKENLISYSFLLYYIKDRAVLLENIEIKYTNLYKPTVSSSKVLLDIWQDLFENELISKHVLSKNEAKNFINKLISDLDL